MGKKGSDGSVKFTEQPCLLDRSFNGKVSNLSKNDGKASNKVKKKSVEKVRIPL